MKANTAPQIVHESETQRQHVRLPLPAVVELGGKEYGVRDLSSGGVGVKDITGEYKRGQHVRLRLRLPFGSFSLDANLEAEVQHYNAKEKTLGCVFVNLSAEHIALLNHVLRAFMAGDIVASGDLLNVAARDNTAKVRNKTQNAAAPDLKKQLPGLVLIGALGLLIAAFILGNLYTSLFVVKAGDAAIAGPVIDLTAPSDGIFHAKLDPGVSLTQPGQTIGAVGGNEIKSPCNCYIVTQTAADGGYVAEGKRLITLIPVNAKPWISAEIDPQLASKIGPDTKATITVFGAKTEYTAHVISMESGLVSAEAQAVPGAARPVVMKLAPDQKIPVDLTNRPATVVFSVR
jgi:hypothetical protein